jgi:Arc-like DNA binding dprotein
MARKRAPGGGRKPGELGLKSATLSLRLPKDMREALAAAATRNKRRSVSEEIVLRLRSTLGRDEVERPRHIRALSDVVARIAMGLEGRTKRPWIEDRYTQAQLSKGIDLFLYTYSRGEAAVPPSVRAEAVRNPEDTFFVERFGELIAGGIIAMLSFPPEPPTTKLPPGEHYPEGWRPFWQLEQDLKSKGRK